MVKLLLGSIVLKKKKKLQNKGIIIIAEKKCSSATVMSISVMVYDITEFNKFYCFQPKKCTSNCITIKPSSIYLTHKNPVVT